MSNEWDFRPLNFAHILCSHLVDISYPALLSSQFMDQFHDKLHQLLKNLLQQSGETRHLLLSWLGGCLQANAGRAKIWANQMPEIFFQMYASDAFFLNLGAALLKLCQPFCRPRSPKLLTFNPTYCALKELSEEERRNRNVHARGLSACLYVRSCICVHVGMDHWMSFLHS